jgi:mono/diheme cytochrome c family protein
MTCIRWGATGILVALAGLAAAQTTRTSESVVAGTDGAALFRTYCATCHGVGAKGDGPLSSSLRTVPPDLTRLARRNDGKFDPDKVHRIIDGRIPVKGHGGEDMPVWGDAFKRSAEGYSEKAVRERIDALVEFLRGLQVDAARK